MDRVQSEGNKKSDEVVLLGKKITELEKKLNDLQCILDKNSYNHLSVMKDEKLFRSETGKTVERFNDLHEFRQFMTWCMFY